MFPVLFRIRVYLAFARDELLGEFGAGKQETVHDHVFAEGGLGGKLPDESHGVPEDLEAMVEDVEEALRLPKHFRKLKTISTL